MNKITIKEITGNLLAVSALDGEKVYTKISESFMKNEIVELDFVDIDLTITAFLNPSIGKLYSIYPTEKIRELLKITNLKQDEIQLLKIVIEKAKERFGKSDSNNESDILNEA